jgi:hypothetical protein
MFVEKRIEPRTPMSLRLRVGPGIDAVTRDISPSGLYFELAGHHEFHGVLFFEMDLEDSNVKFTAEGTIVRIEHHDGISGFAVKLAGGQLQSIE